MVSDKATSNGFGEMLGKSFFNKTGSFWDSFTEHWNLSAIPNHNTFLSKLVLHFEHMISTIEAGRLATAYWLKLNC